MKKRVVVLFVSIMVLLCACATNSQGTENTTDGQETEEPKTGDIVSITGN